MSGLFEDIFSALFGEPSYGSPAPAAPKKPAPKPAVKPAKKPTKKSAPSAKPLQEGEGSDVCAVPHQHDEAYEIKAEPKGDVLLQNVERACGGNRYLEAMVLGESLNAPRFKSGRR